VRSLGYIAGEAYFGRFLGLGGFDGKRKHRKPIAVKFWYRRGVKGKVYRVW
jgi:hypothetical protein